MVNGEWVSVTAREHGLFDANYNTHMSRSSYERHIRHIQIARYLCTHKCTYVTMHARHPCNHTEFYMAIAPVCRNARVCACSLRLGCISFADDTVFERKGASARAA